MLIIHNSTLQIVSKRTENKLLQINKILRYYILEDYYPSIIFIN